MLRTWARALLLSLALTGCAASETPLPATTKILDELPRVSNSTKAPCRMQREVAAQNSYIATVKDKREVVYKAPCDVDQKPQASPESKTS